MRLYKALPADIVETCMYFNLLAFAAFSLYGFSTNRTKQIASAYTSSIVTFILLLGVVVYYHVGLLVNSKKTPEMISATENPLNLSQSPSPASSHKTGQFK